MPNKLNYFIVAIATLLGVLSGWWGSILMKKHSGLSIGSSVAIEVNPFEIITLIVTVLLAIYVTRTLTKRNDLEKLEKEVLIKHFDSFKHELNRKLTPILDKLEAGELDLNKTISDFKIIRKRLDAALKFSKDKGYLSGNEDCYETSKKKLTTIWEELTVPVPKADNRSSISKGNASVARIEKINKTEQELIDLEIAILEIITIINKK